jgi:hypothetical protein
VVHLPLIDEGYFFECIIFLVDDCGRRRDGDGLGSVRLATLVLDGKGRRHLDRLGVAGTFDWNRFRFFFICHFQLLSWDFTDDC